MLFKSRYYNLTAPYLKTGISSFKIMCYYFPSLPQHTELDDDGIVTFNVPKEDSEGYVNNKKDLYKFKFEEVFPEKTQQDEIFEKVKYYNLK